MTTGALLDGPATGELVVRGLNVFAGYWRDEAATAAAFADGWLLTGDVAERDAEGFYRIAGRVKDMYPGGENVYPGRGRGRSPQARAPSRDAAVVGVPDTRWGEAGSRSSSSSAAEAGAAASRAWVRATAWRATRRRARFASSTPCRGRG